MKRKINGMKNIPSFKILTLGCMLVALSCSRKATDFKDFLDDKELVFPGKVTNVTVLPGKQRLMLKWPPSPDPSITKYLVYWNNKMDSLVVNATSHDPKDTVAVLINNLDEYNYSFQLFAYDAEGNRSVVTELNNAQSYGATYQNGLYNRLPRENTPYVVNNDGSATLYFVAPDTINITTRIQYTNAAGQAAVAFIGPDETSVTLPSYKQGEPITFQSSFVPVRNALDTFLTNFVDTFPDVFRLVQCNKGLFREYGMWGDMSAWEGNTSTWRLWDGSNGPQGWPDVFHSGGGAVPGTFSFDMGAVYNNLYEFEETGRNCCHNPTEFEVWGIADITNAVPPLNPTDANWKTEMQNKGWTLIANVVRGDDGVAARKFRFIENVPPVRYMRVRVLKNANGESYVNLSELTFWNKE
ncbi:DUF4998 domain-containing protein [Parasegetibacter sp. NRK P23]|uniref:DUF4998 domain-containing protein n=1 Tax=Parasegetibacter sp. NRK P23 TaxID=2942999 RepID=UPI002043AAE2|nr:DUF4998 domain-containing protein [Parasegetibacter sp. NRK P23]MCM5529202.1 hypothetical protein [Parasegetibacter sp. NRK P23]